MNSPKTLNSKIAVAIVIVMIAVLLGGCTSMKAIKDIDENPDNIARGNPDNPVIVREFLIDVLEFPEGREVKAYNRRAYAIDNKKTLFTSHSFYAFLKDGKLEHTLVFTATPKGSERNGSWMLDAQSDVDSYNLYLYSDNPWELEQYVKRKNNLGLDLELTVQKIIKRLDKDFSFFGPASIRNLPWYHLLWLSAAPPPILTLGSVLIGSIHGDNCLSAIIETMVWRE
ncbi:MAG: hypothetical protein ACQGQO_08370 [Sphaerochaetaceae bacterium]